MAMARVEAESCPTEEALIARATDLIPFLRERAAQCEADGTVPAEVVAAFREAGFFKIVQPVAYGGYGMTPLTLYRVLHEVGRGCMSSGWVLMVLALHSYEIYMMGEAACAAVWGEDPDALVASSYAPLGKMERVDGGYRVDGTWKFCSGIDHAAFVVVGGMVALPGQERPDYRVCLVPAEQYRVAPDSWRAFGLAGTGSKSVEIAEVFVPAARSHSLHDAHLMRGQDRLPPAYRYPFWVAFGLCVASAVIGGTRGGIDELITQMGPRVGSFDMGKGRAPATQDPFVRGAAGQGRGAGARRHFPGRADRRRDDSLHRARRADPGARAAALHGRGGPVRQGLRGGGAAPLQGHGRARNSAGEPDSGRPAQRPGRQQPHRHALRRHGDQPRLAAAGGRGRLPDLLGAARARRATPFSRGVTT